MERGIARILWWWFVILLVISLGLVFHVVLGSVDLSAMPISGFFYVLGRIAGLMGFVFLSLLIFIGDTTRFFDRFFGLDRIIRFNKRFALATTFFVLFHPVFFALSGTPGLGFFFPDFSVVPLAVGVIGFYAYVFVMISSVLYKRISNRGWQYIHVLTYVLFFLVFYHAAANGSSFKAPQVKWVYGTALTGVLCGMAYRTHYKVFGSGSAKAYVKLVRWETRDTFTLVLKPAKRFLFKPGQFCFLRLDMDRLYARHPFTISSSPQDEDLHFTIKLKGRFTRVASKLNVGDEVIVDGPFGVFTIDEGEKDLVFIAGGVGITPFMSMIEYMADKEFDRSVTLLYGSRMEQDIIFKKKLDSIKNKNFSVVYVLSRDYSEDWEGETGHVTQELIEKHVRDTDKLTFFICGPESMKDKLKKTLKQMGVKKAQIKIEEFIW